MMKLDTNSGKLWFGDKKEEMMIVASNLLDILSKFSSKNDGFSFCCSLINKCDSVKIVSFEKV